MQFRTRRWSVLTGAIFSLFLVASTARAETFTLLDTKSSASFDQNNAYSIFSAFGDSQSVAISFYTAIDLKITTIDTYISAPFGGSIDLGIMIDDNGKPSGQYLSKVTIEPSFDPLKLGSLDWTVDAGSRYWLAASPTDDNEDVTWVFNTNIQGALGVQSNGGDWSTESGFAPAVMIQGETPLPASLVLFVSGLGSVGVFGLRRRRKELVDRSV